jgi:hypothetical protein
MLASFLYTFGVCFSSMSTSGLMAAALRRPAAP